MGPSGDGIFKISSTASASELSRIVGPHKQKPDRIMLGAEASLG
jgi:hypothetical protein